MIGLGIMPDSYSYVGLVDSLCELGRIDHAINVYRNVFTSYPDSDANIHAAILHGFVIRGQNHMAYRIFREAVCQNYALDVVCYTTPLFCMAFSELIWLKRLVIRLTR
jgi:pentatricopeptide repeat protein